MAIRSDPEGNEIRALFDMADFSEKHILEIGCGDGRMTARYAEIVEHVTAIDAFEKSIQRAKAILPDTLSDQVEFHNIPLEDFAAATEPAVFDLAVMAWSL